MQTFGGDTRLPFVNLNSQRLGGSPGKGFTASLTRTVKRIGVVVEFADVGVPLITAAGFIGSGFVNNKPSGRVPPASDHVYGCVPPVASSVAE